MIDLDCTGNSSTQPLPDAWPSRCVTTAQYPDHVTVEVFPRVDRQTSGLVDGPVQDAPTSWEDSEQKSGAP